MLNVACTLQYYAEFSELTSSLAYLLEKSFINIGLEAFKTVEFIIAKLTLVDYFSALRFGEKNVSALGL
jgi:hypothetical protein